MRSLGLNSFLIACGGLEAILLKFYPDFKWGSSGNLSHPSKSQRILFTYIKKIFPNLLDIHLDYQHRAMHFDESGHWMELDVYIPSVQLAFEYQGELHYQKYAKLDKRDEQKRRACEAEGITLIEIPYW